jgi:hypothetical protein
METLMIESLLGCVVVFALIRAAYEAYYAIRLSGFERGLKAAEPIVDQLAKTAYTTGRIHERAAMQSEVAAIYDEGFRQGQLSKSFPTVFTRN